MYPSLRFNVQLYRVLATLSLIGGVIGFFGSILGRNAEFGIAIIALISGIIGGLIFLGMSDLYRATLDIAEQTQLTLNIIKRIKSKS